MRKVVTMVTRMTRVTMTNSIWWSLSLVLSCRPKQIRAWSQEAFTAAGQREKKRQKPPRLLMCIWMDESVLSRCDNKRANFGDYGKHMKALESTCKHLQALRIVDQTKTPRLSRNLSSTARAPATWQILNSCRTQCVSAPRLRPANGCARYSTFEVGPGKVWSV